MANRLSATEESILDQLQVSEPKLVAKALGIELSTLYQHLRRIRLKYKAAREFVNFVDGRYRRHGTVKKYLYYED